MTEKTAATAAFAPAWPRIYSTSYSAESETFPSYSRTRVFNHDLTNEQLKPLIEDCPTPGRKLRRIGGITLICAYSLLCLLILFAMVVRVRIPGDFPTMQDLDTGSQALGLVTFTAVAVWLTGAALDFVARRKWVAALLGAWEIHAGHVVRVRDLPADRQRNVNSLSERLDVALKDLDASDPAAQHLDLAARAAIVRYFELPVISEDAIRVAKSTVADPAVENIRAEYKADTAAEKASLQDAQEAVRAVGAYVETLKTAAAEREIVSLARTIAESSF